MRKIACNAAAAALLLALAALPAAAQDLALALRPPGCNATSCTGCLDYTVYQENITDSSGNIAPDACGSDGVYFPGALAGGPERQLCSRSPTAWHTLNAAASAPAVPLSFFANCAKFYPDSWRCVACCSGKHACPPALPACLHTSTNHSHHINQHCFESGTPPPPPSQHTHTHTPPPAPAAGCGGDQCHSAGQGTYGAASGCSTCPGGGNGTAMLLDATTCRSCFHSHSCHSEQPSQLNGASMCAGGGRAHMRVERAVQDLDHREVLN